MDTPTLAGFIAWAAVAMGIGPTQLDPDSVFWGYAFNVSLAVVNLQLQCALPPVYMLATYNLAGDNLINWAVDTPPSTFFANLRASYGCNNFTAGVVSASSDEGTSVSIDVVEALTNLTIGQLQNLKTPYGRQYLAFASEVGSLWGVS